ncbi:MAG: DedA family protein [Candidatus Doudnabacteria bacterium]
MANLLIYISGFITHTIDILGYGGVVLLMAIESAAIPLPSEIIMPFAGFLVLGGRFSLIGLGIAGGIGSVIGSSITYFLGYYGGRPLIARYGHLVFLSERELEFTEKFFKKFGLWSTFLGRLLPVVRTFISIPAGMGKVDFLKFSILTFAGSFIWSYFLAWLGLRLGENWHSLEAYFRKFDLLIAAVIVILVAWWVSRHFRKKKS